MRSRTPNIRAPKLEVLGEHENLERAIKAALVITAAGAVHHYASRNGKGYAYLRPSKFKEINFEIGITKLNTIKQLFGKAESPDGGLSHLDEAEITIIDQTADITASEIDQAFSEDVADSGY